MRFLLCTGAAQRQLPALRRLLASRGICRQQQFSTEADPDFDVLDLVAWANEPAPLKRALTHWKLNQRFQRGELGVTGPRKLVTAQDVAEVVKPLEWPGASGMGSVWDRGSKDLVSALAAGHTGFWAVLDASLRGVLEHKTVDKADSKPSAVGMRVAAVESAADAAVAAAAYSLRRLQAEQLVAAGRRAASTAPAASTCPSPSPPPPSPLPSSSRAPPSSTPAAAVVAPEDALGVIEVLNGLQQLLAVLRGNDGGGGGGGGGGRDGGGGAPSGPEAGLELFADHLEEYARGSKELREVLLARSHFFVPCLSAAATGRPVASFTLDRCGRAALSPYYPRSPWATAHLHLAAIVPWYDGIPRARQDLDHAAASLSWAYHALRRATCQQPPTATCQQPTAAHTAISSSPPSSTTTTTTTTTNGGDGTSPPTPPPPPPPPPPLPRYLEIRAHVVVDRSGCGGYLGWDGWVGGRREPTNRQLRGWMGGRGQLPWVPRLSCPPPGMAEEEAEAEAAEAAYYAARGLGGSGRGASLTPQPLPPPRTNVWHECHEVVGHVVKHREPPSGDDEEDEDEE